MDWLVNNLGTLIVAAVLVILVALVVVKMIRDKKKGKTSCGCGCEHCAMASKCHQANKT
ncbi:MAG: FeoB-associated Cys-rich membrane protein [Lachnospiraceae bacterium]|nr:FeoB-associated Cys-rich membrane protein [Lachnospiraceae bacterium]